MEIQDLQATILIAESPWKNEMIWCYSRSFQQEGSKPYPQFSQRWSTSAASPGYTFLSRNPCLDKTVSAYLKSHTLCRTERVIYIQSKLNSNHLGLTLNYIEVFWCVNFIGLESNYSGRFDSHRLQICLCHYCHYFPLRIGNGSW